MMYNGSKRAKTNSNGTVIMRVYMVISSWEDIQMHLNFMSFLQFLAETLWTLATGF